MVRRTSGSLMFNQKNEQKKMKKFWNLMLAALVIIGAAACTENYENIEKAEGFSFYAEIANGTRATIADENGDKTWETKWGLGDKLYVNDTYEFVCTDVEKGKFTCYNDAVAELAGSVVTITTDGKHHSLQGANAFYTRATVENFGEGKVELQPLTSFFRFTYNGTGNVKLSLSEPLFRTEDSTAANEITVSGNGEQFVAFWPTGEEVTLSYSVNGEIIRTTTKAFAAGMVYNLGTLVASNASEYGVVGSFQGWDVAAPVKMTHVASDWAWVVAKNVELYKDDKIKIVKGNSWDVSFGLQNSSVVAVDKEQALIQQNSQDILVAKNGKFDIYFKADGTMFKYECVEEYTNLMVDITIDNQAKWSPLTITLKDGNTVIADKKTVTGDKFSISGEHIGKTLEYQFFTNGKQTDVDNVNITHTGATIIVKEPAAVKNMVYLKPGPWAVDNAWFAAYFWYPANASWKKMVYNSAKDAYECEVPDNCGKVIFCRMDGGKTALDWSSKWNQTNDITNLTENIGKCCTITGWGGSDFKWGSI